MNTETENEPIVKRADCYQTPPELAAVIADHALKAWRRCKPGRRSPKSALEPGSGFNAPFLAALCSQAKIETAIGVELRRDPQEKIDTGDGFEVLTGIDLLNPLDGVNSSLIGTALFPDQIEHRGGYDLIVTNPPFSHAENFIRRAYELIRPDGLIVFLLRLGFYATIRRGPLFAQYPPASIRVLVPRPSFSGGGNDSTEYAVFSWLGVDLEAERQAAGQLTTIERLIWK